MNIVKEEPVLISGVVAALLTLLAAFGVPLANDQRESILAFVAAALAVAGAVVARSQVTPVATVRGLRAASYDSGVEAGERAALLGKH
ncbi:MAG: hypothetical protein H0W29_10250 [Gemmatimonadales bacterium]|nr:hypothetical protein [Gemmatimonadales bacterium]